MRWLSAGVIALLILHYPAVHASATRIIDDLEVNVSDNYTYVCEQGNSVTFQCPSGSRIKVVEAFWGAWSAKAYNRCYNSGCVIGCGQDAASLSSNNNTRSVVEQVAKVCDGSQSCRIPAGANRSQSAETWPLNLFLGFTKFSDLGAAVPKYVLVTYDCVSPTPPPLPLRPPQPRPQPQPPREGSSPCTCLLHTRLPGLTILLQANKDMHSSNSHAPAHQLLQPLLPSVQPLSVLALSAEA
jgi:hypothetical protein